jgi:hypothetical protein
MVVAAPTSFAPQSVMSNGRIWSLYQGCAISLKPETSDREMLRAEKNKFVWMSRPVP